MISYFPSILSFWSCALASKTYKYLSIYLCRYLHNNLPLCREVSNCSSLHLSGRFSSPSGRLSVFDKLQDFFPKHSYGKIAATVRTTWIPVWTSSSKRQVSYSKSRRPDAGQHGLDAHASDMEIVCFKSTVQTIIPLVWTGEAFIWKLLAVEVRPSGRQGTTVRTRLRNRKEFQWNSREVDCTVVRPDGPWLPFGWHLVFIMPDAHLNRQPINRGP
jgi:hypothetical protein